MSDDLKWLVGGVLIGMRALAPYGVRLSAAPARRHGVLRVSVAADGVEVSAEVDGVRLYRWLDSGAASWELLLANLRRREAQQNGGMKQLDLF